MIRIYPTGNAFIPGVPAVEQDVPKSKAHDYLNWNPPAFTTQPPEAGPGHPEEEAPASPDSGAPS